MAEETGDEFEIEDGIEIPERTFPKRDSKWEKLLSEMKKGQSRKLASSGQVASIRSKAKDMGIKIVVRKLPDGYRVWRDS